MPPTHHQGDLQQRGELVLVLDVGLGVHQPPLVAEAAVGAHQHLLRHRLTEHLHLQGVGQDLLRLLEEEEEEEEEVVIVQNSIISTSVE